MSVLPIHTEPDEMIYDDVELGEEGGCNSSLDNGWSSSEFESYDEASDGEGRPENGLPHAFMRGKPPQRKTHVCSIINSCPSISIMASNRLFFFFFTVLYHYHGNGGSHRNSCLFFVFLLEVMEIRSCIFLQDFHMPLFESSQHRRSYNFFV